MTIGEFGRRAGLSVKALRLYEGSGLLPPAEVDPSGYRRYTAGQLDRASRISLLRRLGMPLAVIAETLDLPDAEAVRRLDRWWAAEEAAAAARRESYTWLRTRLAHGDEPPRRYAVHIDARPARKVATLHIEVDQEHLVPEIGAAEWEIRRHLEDQDAAATGEHWVIYHGQVTPDSEAQVEVCVPFTGPIEPSGRITIRIEPARLVAYAEVTRDDCFYPRITQAYEAVFQHVRAAGLIHTAPPREIYLDSWDRLAATDPFVHVAQPFEG
ncbi:MerR family transcriptional regulator [Actinoplanes xinjiangensis]|jgi:DNA-binding transcriptional MerR regulator|uniref:MerR family transcriptional regulator n=1 Tax=Actinoplanes xinjiangensis TaxID=512350 RepID=A0A316FPQ4_9ACTN|nr:MerR family transcriptional regulator [Actinoplanes xinjiangensis]PWK50122.1 MerR family transcriptional regulator [Actinoplanes xinjiangensis]GIF36010.1 MerR family transcriptional regulator [Actinoplanes xinjiangensis]